METTLSYYVKAFGWSILNSLWQSAIIYGILFIVLFSLPKLAAKYKHNLAFGSIIFMFLGFGYNLIHQITLNFNKGYSVKRIENINTAYFKNLPQDFSSKAEQYFPLVVSFYIIGIILQLFVISKGYRQLSKFKNVGISIIPNEWKAIFESVTEHLKINKVIKFQLSSIVNVPLVIGYLKPVILFPISLVNHLNNEQVEAILIHELSHIRRNDFLLNLIKTSIETLLFYNPFIWMAGRFISIEREHACDDLVLKITGKPLNYAHALLKLELLKDKSSPTFSLAATGKSQNLYQRIKRITNMKTNYLNAKQQMAALTLGVACLFSIAWITPAEKRNNNKEIAKINFNAAQFKGNNKPKIYLDTTKKRKIKIVTVDANGKKTEYNSVKEMPDSIKNDFLNDNLSFGNSLMLNLDSTNLHLKIDTARFALMNKRFASAEFRAQMASVQKNALKLAKTYNSPEAQAKWKKFGEAVAKEYSSPEAQAKWKKFGEEVAKEYSSPEAQAKWKKFGEDVAKEYSSPEAQERYKKIAEDALAIASISDYKSTVNEIKFQALSAKDFKNKSAYTRSVADSAFKAKRQVYGLKSGKNNYVYIDGDNELRQNQEYKKLKEKFDKEVKELKEKLEKTERKEKTEKPEKPEL